MKLLLLLSVALLAGFTSFGQIISANGFSAGGGGVSASSMLDANGVYNIYTNSSGGLTTNGLGHHGSFWGHDYFGNFYAASTNGYLVYSNAASRVELELFSTTTGTTIRAVGDNSTGTVTLNTNGTFTGNGGGLTNLQAGNFVGTVPAANLPVTVQTFIVPMDNVNRTFAAGSTFVSIGSQTANTSELIARQQFSFSGIVTNLVLDIYNTASALLTTTNITAYFFTNSVLCGSLNLTLLGNGQGNAHNTTNSSGSFTFTQDTNYVSLCLSNSAATTTPNIRVGYTFQVLNEKP